MSAIVKEVRLSDGSTFLAEVESTADESGSPRQRVSLGTPARINFDEAMSNIQAAAARFIDIQKTLISPPDSCEIVFGVKVSAEGNAILAKMSGDVNFSVTLKWDAQARQKQ